VPYIIATDGRRESLRNNDTAKCAGELNFQIFSYVKNNMENGILTHVIKGYIDNFLGDKRNYQKYNDLTGALVCCRKEIKRRLGIDLKVLGEILDSYNKEIAIYENLKIKENGDVK